MKICGEYVNPLSGSRAGPQWACSPGNCMLTIDRMFNLQKVKSMNTTWDTSAVVLETTLIVHLENNIQAHDSSIYSWIIQTLHTHTNIAGLNLKSDYLWNCSMMLYFSIKCLDGRAMAIISSVTLAWKWSSRSVNEHLLFVLHPISKQHPWGCSQTFSPGGEKASDDLLV